MTKSPADVMVAVTAAVKKSSSEISKQQTPKAQLSLSQFSRRKVTDYHPRTSSVQGQCPNPHTAVLFRYFKCQRRSKDDPLYTLFTRYHQSRLFSLSEREVEAG
jgi:hypothetical protein